jgi:hypothetical protein
MKMFDRLKKFLYKDNNSLKGETLNMNEETGTTEDVPTLETPGTTFRLTELKIKIDSLARESWFIRLQENKLGNKYHKSQSKIISKYLEPDKTFVDESLPTSEDLQRSSGLIGEESKIAYNNLRMRKRYQKAKDIAKEKHPEIFAEPKLEKYISDRYTLHDHRVGLLGVSSEIRINLLAYGFMRGRRYSQIETDPRWKHKPYDRPQPNWNKVAEIIQRYTNIPGKRAEITRKLSDEIMRWKGN